MCEATVYLQRVDKRVKAVEDVVPVESAGTRVMVRRPLEPSQTILGVIREVDQLEHPVILATEGLGQ